MENEERGHELTESCIRERGTRLDWLGQEVPWDVFLTRASIALGIISAAKESTYYTKCLALEKLFEIAKMERKKRQKEMFRCVQEEELTPGNVQAVLRDAAQKFLGDENLSARISPVNCTLVRKGVGVELSFAVEKWNGRILYAVALLSFILLKTKPMLRNVTIRCWKNYLK